MPLAWLRVALPIVAVIVATGTLVQGALVGHSGAKATWSDKTSASPSVR